MVGEGLLEGREEMFRRDFRKRRGLERRLPGPQQRVHLRGLHLLGFRHDNSRFRRLYLAASYITRSGFFGPFTLDRAGLFIEIAAPKQDLTMSSQTPSTATRRIIWPSVVTVVSAAILIGAEVFGAA